MLLSRQRLSLLPLLATAYAVSCAVFPDEAVLPTKNDAQLGGERNDPTAGSTGDAGGELVTAGRSNGGGGGAGQAGSGDPAEGGVAGTGEATGGGEGGAGGVTITTCAAPKRAVITVTDDTWISSVKPRNANGGDEQLFVAASTADQRRLLLWVNLPAAPAGARLLNATLDLNLESNADTTLTERRLALHVVTQQFVENRTTWVNFDNGLPGRWDAQGGDFESDVISQATVPAGIASGVVSFDVTKPLGSALSANPSAVPLLVREEGIASATAGLLAFTSAEGNAPPSLVIEYCQP